MAKSLKLNDEQYWDTAGIVHKKNILDEIIDKLNVNNAIMVTATQDQVVQTSNGTQIQFDTIVSKIGNELKLVNSFITIGKGIKYVEINANIWTENYQGYAWISILKNYTETVACNMKPTRYSDSWGTQTISGVIVPVSEGDVISADIKFNIADLQYNKLCGGTYSRSVIFSVKEIKDFIF